MCADKLTEAESHSPEKKPHTGPKAKLLGRFMQKQSNLDHRGFSLFDLYIFLTLCLIYQKEKKSLGFRFWK